MFSQNIGLKDKNLMSTPKDLFRFSHNHDESCQCKGFCCQSLWQLRWRSTTSSHWSWMPQVRKVMADHLGLPVLDQSLKEAFSPRFVDQRKYFFFQLEYLSVSAAVSTVDLNAPLKKSAEISASSSSIDFVGNLTHVMWEIVEEIHSPSNNQAMFNNCAQSSGQHSKRRCRVTDYI